MAAKLKKVMSFADLRQRANGDIKYQKLAVVAAKNLGGTIPENVHLVEQFVVAMKILKANADLTDNEKGVIDEINFVRDLVK
jgi:hypothetical protein